MKATRTFVKVLVLSLALLMAFPLSACGKSSQLKGFDIDLARATATELGLSVEFVEIDWNQKDNELKAKNIDLIWNGFTITEPRKETTTFSEPYMVNSQVLVIRKADASKYTTLESMATAKIVAEGSSVGEEVVKENDTLKNATISSVPNMVGIFTELISGTSDVGVMDAIMAGYYLETNSNYASKLQLQGTKLAEEEYGIGMRKDSLGLQDKINTALAKLTTNGKIAEIAAEYGLEDVILPIEYTSKFNTLSTAEKADWEYISGRGKIIVGYTLFAPIAF